MRRQVIFCIFMAVVLSSCTRDYDCPEQCIEVHFRNKGANHLLVTNVKTRYYINDGNMWVRTFDDYVSLEKKRIDNPCVVIYHVQTGSQLAIIKLEDCKCTDTEYVYDRLIGKLTKDQPTIIRFYVEVP